MLSLATVLFLAQLSLDDIGGLLTFFFKAVVAGSIPANTVAALVLIGFIAVLRWAGPKLSAILPDHTLVDKGLKWIFESRPGGWLLNSLTTTSAALLAFVAADPTQPVTLAVWGSALAGAFTLAGILEFLRDILGWWKPAAELTVEAKTPTA